MKPGYFCFFNTRLGRCFFAATPKGLCRLQWMGSEREILRDLKSEYPEFGWREDRKRLMKYALGLERFLNKGRKFVPALDLRGTNFQRKVWKAMGRIPLGKTMSYRRLAAASGHPRAVRAAANACGQNPIAVAVPCHRVICSDGSLGGYGAGLWRKKFLLKLERICRGENRERDFSRKDAKTPRRKIPAVLFAP